MSKLMQRAIIAIGLAGSGLLSLAAPKGAAPQARPTAWRAYTNTNYVNRPAFDGDAVWAATGGGVVRWNRADGTYVKYTTLQDWTTYTTANTAGGLADNRVYAIAIDAAGHKWFGTWDGVSEFDGQSWTTYTTADGLAHNIVYAIAIDQAGNEWFGTQGGGVSGFDGHSWTTYTPADGLAADFVYAIAIDQAGHKWFGTLGGVSEFDGQSWTTFTTADGLAGDLVLAIAVDAAGHKWFGTWVGGVSEFDGQDWTTYTTADGLAGIVVSAIAIDAAGHKWFGTHGGVSEFDGQDWTTYTVADGLAHGWVQAIAIDAAGHMWFGTAGGVSEFFQGARLLLPLILRGHYPLCDGYEPNDGCAEAYGPLSIGQGYEAYLCPGDPEDWYSIDLAAGQAVTIALAVPEGVDYDLFLLDRDCDYLDTSVREGKGVDEDILHTPTYTGIYHLLVYPATPDAHSGVHPYVLEVHR